MTTRIPGIVIAVACSVSGTAEATTNLKPFEPVMMRDQFTQIRESIVRPR